jgi:predicted dehydrogenase
MKKLRVGLIGSGGIANICHVPGYLEVKDRVEIVALCDIRPEAIKNTRGRWNLDVPGYEKFADMLKKEKPDAVSVCTPNTVHRRATVAALKAGCHVLCEKPIATSAKDAQAMVDAAKKARRQLMIGQSGRFSSGPQAMRRAVDAGMLGDVYYARAHAIRRREIPARDTFLRKSLSGGGPMYDIGVHMLDLALWLMDFPKPVTASGAVDCRFGRRKGVIGTWGQWDPEMFEVETLSLEASFASNIDRPLMNVWLLGTEGGCDCEQQKIFSEEAGTLWDRSPYGLPKAKAYHVELAAFVDALLQKDPVPVPASQAVVTQRILDAVYASAAKGKEVAVR